MKCENVQELISSFIDGEILENIDIAFSHTFECKECQEFLKITLKFKSEAKKNEVILQTEKRPEITGLKKRSITDKIKSKFKVEIPIPAPLLSAVIFMLFLLSFLLAVFVYDRAIEMTKIETQAYREKTRMVIVYGIPQITVYPEQNNIKQK
jgi:hypothetical protein